MSDKLNIIFRDSNGEPIRLDTHIANVPGIGAPSVDEDDLWLGRWDAVKPRLVDKEKQPVMTDTAFVNVVDLER